MTAAPITAAEGALIGGLLMEPDRMDDVPAELQASDFSDHDLGRLFRAMKERHHAGQPCDPVSITADLPPRLADVLQDCIAYVATAANVPYHATAVLAAGVRRQLEVGLSALGRSAQEHGTPPADILASAAALVDAADGRLNGARSDEGTTAEQGMHHVLSEAEAAARGELAGIGTGFSSIDKATGGFRPGELWILGARPAMGKTMLATQLAATAAAAGNNVVFVSLEMRGGPIWSRLAAGESGINPMKVRAGTLNTDEWGRLAAAGRDLTNRLGNRLLILDRTGSGIDGILARLRQLHRRGQCRLAVLDFLQRVGPGRDGAKAGNRNGELEVVSRRLADFAREAGVTVIACSQLSRQAEGNRPNLGHLRDCGSLEADADNVLFLHRPDEADTADRELILAKCRDGKVGAVQLRLDANRMRFLPITRALEPVL